MKRIRARVEIAWRAAVDFEVEDDLDDEEIQCIAIAAVNRGEWEDDRAEVVSIEIMDEPPASGDLIQERPGANSPGRQAGVSANLLHGEDAFAV
jgi:hypothetical protein